MRLSFPQLSAQSVGKLAELSMRNDVRCVLGVVVLIAVYNIGNISNAHEEFVHKQRNESSTFFHILF